MPRALLAVSAVAGVAAGAAVTAAWWRLAPAGEAAQAWLVVAVLLGAGAGAVRVPRRWIGPLAIAAACGALVFARHAAVAELAALVAVAGAAQSAHRPGAAGGAVAGVLAGPWLIVRLSLPGVALAGVAVALVAAIAARIIRAEADDPRRPTRRAIVAAIALGLGALAVVAPTLLHLVVLRLPLVEAAIVAAVLAAALVLSRTGVAVVAAALVAAALTLIVPTTRPAESRHARQDREARLERWQRIARGFGDDVVVTPILEPWTAASAARASTEHYVGATDRTHVVWLNLWQVGPDEVIAVADAARSAFLHVSLWRGDTSRRWGTLAIVASPRPIAFAGAPDDAVLYVGDWEPWRDAATSDHVPRLALGAAARTLDRAVLINARLVAFYRDVLAALPRRPPTCGCDPRAAFEAQLGAAGADGE